MYTHSELLSARDQTNSAKALLPPLPKRNAQKDYVEPRSGYQNTTISNEDERSPSRDYTPAQTHELRINDRASTAMFAKEQLRDLSKAYDRQQNSLANSNYLISDVHAQSFSNCQQESQEVNQNMNKRHSQMSSMMSAQFQPLLSQDQRELQVPRLEERALMMRGQTSRNGMIKSVRSQDGKTFTLGDRGIMSGNNVSLNPDALSLNLPQSPVPPENALVVQRNLSKPYISTISSTTNRIDGDKDKISPLKSQFHHQQNPSHPVQVTNHMQASTSHYPRQNRSMSHQPLSSRTGASGANYPDPDMTTQQMASNMTQLSYSANQTGELSQTAKLLLSHHKELIKEANRPRDSSVDNHIRTRANTNLITTSGTDFKGPTHVLSQRMPPRPFNAGHPIINDPSITYTSQAQIAPNSVQNQHNHWLSAHNGDHDLSRLDSRKPTYQSCSPEAPGPRSFSNRLPHITEQFSVENETMSQNHSQVTSMQNQAFLLKQELTTLRKQLSDARSTHMFLKKQILQHEHQNNLQAIKINQLEQALGQKQQDTEESQIKLEQLADMYKVQEQLGEELARKQAESEKAYLERIEQFDIDNEILRNQKLKNYHNIQANLLQLSSGLSYLVEIFGQESYLVPFLVHFEKVCQVLKTQVGEENGDLLNDKTAEATELQMRYMKKIQSFEKFKKEVKSLIKNHYKQKVNEKVQIKVAQQVQLKEDELQQAFKAAKKAEKELKRQTDQLTKLKHLYNDSQNSLQIMAQERQLCEENFEIERQNTMSMHQSEVQTLRDTIKAMHKKIKLLEKLKQEAVAHISHADNNSTKNLYIESEQSESIQVTFEPKETLMSEKKNKKYSEKELLKIQNDKFRETLEGQNILISQLQRALVSFDNSKYQSQKSYGQSIASGSQLNRADNVSSNDHFIYIPMKSERSDNKTMGNMPVDEELTSADGDSRQSPERVGDKLVVNFPQHIRKRSQPENDKVLRQNMASVAHSDKRSSEYFHETTPLSTVQDVEALQSAYLETTNENSRQFIAQEFSLGKMRRGVMSHQEIQRESSVDQHLENAKQAVKNLQHHFNPSSQASSHQFAENQSEPRFEHAVREQAHSVPNLDKGMHQVSAKTHSEGQSVTQLTSGFEPYVDNAGIIQTAQSYVNQSQTQVTKMGNASTSKETVSQNSSSITRKTVPTKIKGHI